MRQGQTNEPRSQQVNDIWEFLIRRIWEHILTMEHTVLARKQDQYWQMYAPHLIRLAEASSVAMLDLASAIKMHTNHLPLPDLEDALANTASQLNNLQNIRQDKYLDDLLRFFSFFYTLEEIGRKLQRLSSSL